MSWTRLLSRIIAVGSLCVAAFAGAQPDGKDAPKPKEEATSPAPVAEEKTPEPAPTSEVPAPAPAPSGPDLSAVKAELSSVLDELIEARTRVSLLQKALFKTSLDVTVVRRADDQRLRHITLRLDGVPVHDSDGAALLRGEARLFQGYAAPGTHELTIEVSEEAKQNDVYRYTRVERFRFEIKKGTRTKVEVVLRDASDMAEELPEGDDGEYDVRTLVRIEAERIEER